MVFEYFFIYSLGSRAQRAEAAKPRRYEADVDTWKHSSFFNSIKQELLAGNIPSEILHTNCSYPSISGIRYDSEYLYWSSRKTRTGSPLTSRHHAIDHEIDLELCLAFFSTTWAYHFTSWGRKPPESSTRKDERENQTTRAIGEEKQADQLHQLHVTIYMITNICVTQRAPVSANTYSPS